MEPPARLSCLYRVRFDEADTDGRLRPSGLLRYAQDMAWRHSEEAGFDRAWYDLRAIHWLVRNVTLRLSMPVSYGDELAISTEVTGWRHVWARRHAEVRLQNALVAEVDTDWVLLRDDGRPSAVPAEIARRFSPGTGFTREKIVLPAPDGDVSRFTTHVRPTDVDPLKHMNNAAYLDMVDDGMVRLLDGRRVSSEANYRIGYVAPALLGTAVDIASWRVNERLVATRITDAGGTELAKALVEESGS